jgi:hypothetical protein
MTPAFDVILARHVSTLAHGVKYRNIFITCWKAVDFHIIERILLKMEIIVIISGAILKATLPVS